MLSTASRASPRARLLQSGPAVSSSAGLSSRCALQTREFCFGAWASHHHGRDGRRRHRAARYHYLESLNRNLSWDNDANNTIKKAMDAFAQASQTSHKRYVNPEEVKSWSDEVSGVRPGKNIEDVERSAIDHLIRGDKPLSYDHDMWKSPLRNIRNYLGSHHDEQNVTWRNTATNVDDPTSIDPITNRRRAKNVSSQSSSAPLYNDLDGYSPTDFSEPPYPVSSDQNYNDLDSYGPAEDAKASQQVQANKYSDLDKYTPVMDDASAGAQQKNDGYKDLDKYDAMSWNEPDGLRKATAEETSKEYDDLGKYSSTTIDDPFAPRTLTPEEQSKLYKDLDQYKAAEWNEPDGLRKETGEEMSKNYDDLHKYGAVHWNEPDGLRKTTPEELSKHYKDLPGYGPAVWSEPDGLRRLTPEEESKKYDDLESYDAPFVAPSPTLRAHEAAQMDATPRGKPVPAKVDAPAEDLANKYEDLDQYGPIRWNEPDGLRKLTAEEQSKNYDDLHMYGAVKWNEPDGLRNLTPEESSKQYGDVPLYAPRDMSDEVNAQQMHPEEASKNYKDLPAYHHYENADPVTARIHPEEASKQYEDLGKYSAHDNTGPEQDRIHPEEASKEYKDLHKYPRAGFEEVIASKQVHPEGLRKHYEDLDSYQPSSFDAIESPPSVTMAYKDLDGYGAVRHNEPDGKPALQPDAVARGLGEYDSKAGPQDTTNGLQSSVTYPLSHRNPGADPEPMETNSETLTAEGIRAATLRRAYELSQEHQMEQSEDQVASLDSEPTAKLTGNYVRDFPEEFTASWSIENSLSKSTLLPNRARDSEAAEEQDGAELRSMDECFPSKEGRVQPCLDRAVSRDPYSHEPRGLETSFAEECGLDSLPRLEKHYASKSSATDEPSSYKILAYDSALQTMSIAEATTSVEASESPSTLADVLLRLSNPSKFLPHFEGLQAQGYEVVSGSGDVLIFRKVREATAAAGEGAPSGFVNVGAPRVNPIDMMGRSAVSNFASPTGFVNYETLSESMDKEEQEKQEQGGPAVERVEETVKTRAPAGHGKKRRLGRKLALGTAGVAGSAYAVSMLAERVSTREVRREEARARRG